MEMSCVDRLLIVIILVSILDCSILMEVSDEMNFFNNIF